MTSLTVSALCQRWSCSRRLITDAIKSGRLRAFVVGKLTWRIALAEVERYELEQTGAG